MIDQKSKQARAKEAQGWTKKGPTCASCAHFHCESDPVMDIMGRYTWTVDKKMRCTKGGFKTGKSSWCKLHKES